MIASDILLVKNGITRYDCFHCDGYICASDDIVFDKINQRYYHTRCKQEEEESIKEENNSLNTN